ncbi:hypothetical protein [Haloquadratum walsbyi]|jgi:Single-stranded DNA-binding replication protein A (RPA), large (70 kD) subunit and related ssDNA-binding proteins|uniref:Replication factor A n=1 Tax=Haloquadratum walsbyi J07HQW2 TaxID=1238425 RepID=U1MTR2_9EURY|nr:hypothetical protein [Haloquadratum walsbyi]ERG93679.1 MAG: hypothetical protein J07HQW2_00112 [Haloquadratum walsbyi J07HQW2]
MTEITVDSIRGRLDNEFSETIQDTDIQTEIDAYLNFGVSDPKTLIDGVIDRLAENNNTSKTEVTQATADASGAAPLTTIEDMGVNEEWITLEAEVIQLWDNDSESISQVGLLSDGTGRVQFTSWAKSDVIILVENEQYRFENVVTDEYQDNPQVKLNSSTDISLLQDDDKKDISHTVEFTGSCVSIQDGSGMIRRCTKDGCSRVLTSDSCQEHGAVDSEYDLRLKLVLDNGTEVQNVVCNREITEELTGMTLEEANSIAQESLDTDAPGREMEPLILGSYFTVSGNPLGDFIAANEIATATDSRDVEELLINARSLSV